MPEQPPDLEQIALRLMDWSDDEVRQHRIVEQLRLVWNARGAADIAELDTELSDLMGGSGRPYVQSLSRALRRLDR